MLSKSEMRQNSEKYLNIIAQRSLLILVWLSKIKHKLIENIKLLKTILKINIGKKLATYIDALNIALRPMMINNLISIYT